MLTKSGKAISVMCVMLLCVGVLVRYQYNKTSPQSNSEVIAVATTVKKQDNTVSLVSPVIQKNVPRIKSIKILDLSSSRVVALLGEVGENALIAAAKITQLNKYSSDPIFLILSGPGGSVVTGSILISAIEASKAPIITICDVLCASMDSMIHQYGHKRYMTDRSIIMFHPASAGAQGDIDRMYSMVSFLKKYTNKIEQYVAERQGITFSQYKEKTSTEIWIDAEDAVSEKIADGLVNYSLPLDPTVSFGMSNTSSTPSTSPLEIKWICTTGLCKDVKWKTLK